MEPTVIWRKRTKDKKQEKKTMKPTDDVWEQRRYEIAKDVLAQFAGSDGVGFKNHALCADFAVKWADDLIKELRKDCGE